MELPVWTTQVIISMFNMACKPQDQVHCKQVNIYINILVFTGMSFENIFLT